jgi:single-stranded DNA-binding protein
MSDIKSINKVMFAGAVVGNPEFGKEANGTEFCAFTLQTEEYLIVKGQSRVVQTRHEVYITNKIVVPSFKRSLRPGFHVFVVGKLGYRDGRATVIVQDFGHEAMYLHVPSDAPEAPAQAAKGGAAQVDSAPPKPTQSQAANGGQRRGDDEFFSPSQAFARPKPSTAPEGFEDTIPF